MDLKKNSIIVIIDNKMFNFRSSYKVAEFFKNEENINDINGITPEILEILTKPYLINRVLKCIKGEEQQFLLKEKTRNKYTKIPKFTIIRS
jgi:predicted glycosyl hydrolase (DUF1957 family)